MTRRLSSKNAQQTFAFGLDLGRKVIPGDCICLEGPLGSGKTVFTKGIARALKIQEEITSPTFTLISEYSAQIDQQKIPFYHIDLYRIDQLQDLYDLGLEELFDQRAVSVIEWSERGSKILPENRITVRFELLPQGERILTIEGNSA